MTIDVDKLQEIVDKMSKPGKEKWVLDPDYASTFFNFISPYIKKAAYISEYNIHGDPEDAFAEVQWEVWRALEKYGPRPKGNLFGNYTLKLKTNNVLTNREKKRASHKSRINFVSESLDYLEAQEVEGEKRYNAPSCAHFDLCLLKEEFIKRSKKEDRKVNIMINKINRLNYKEKLEVFYLLMSSITGEPYENCIKQFINLFLSINFITKLKPFLYNKNEDWKNLLELEETMQNDLVNVKVGDKFVTLGGKVIEIRSKARKGFKILVMLTGKEIPVDDDYIKNNVTRYVEGTDPVEKTFALEIAKKVEEVITKDPPKEPVEQKVVEPTEKIVVEPSKKTKNESGSKPETNKKLGKKGKKKMKKTPKETKKAFILKMLNEGPQTRGSLAAAIIENGLSKHNDVKKEKSYASVILYNLEKDKVPIVKLERGTYVLEGVMETLANAPKEESVETPEE